MQSLAVAPREKFEPLRALPSCFAVTDEVEAVAVKPEHYEPLAEIIAGDPDIQKLVSWASLVKGPEDVKAALESRTRGTLLGRFVLARTDISAVFGSLAVFPGERDKEYGFGGAFVEASQRGSNIADKASGALMKEVVQALDPRSLYAQIAPDNAASIATAIKHGCKPAEMVWDPALQLQEQRFRLELPREQAA